MVHTVKSFFNKYIKASSEVQDRVSEHSLHVAAAALMIEMMRADADINEDEMNTITKTLQSNFGLSKVEITAIIRFAEEEISKSTGYFEFTSLINKSLNPEQKIRIIEHLWEVAFSDTALDKHEEHMVRRIANLIHVPHKEFINAKLKVRKRLLGK